MVMMQTNARVCNYKIKKIMSWPRTNTKQMLTVSQNHTDEYQYKCSIYGTNIKENYDYGNTVYELSKNELNKYEQYIG